MSDDASRPTTPAPTPRPVGAERPGPWQQRWHQVLVYFGLANPYPWEELDPEDEQAETGPRFTGWRAVAAAIVFFAPLIVVAFLRSPLAGVVASVVVAVVLGVQGSLGSGLRARYPWVEEYGSIVGMVVLFNVAVSTNEVGFVEGVAYIAGYCAIVFPSIALISRFEPER